MVFLGVLSPTNPTLIDSLPSQIMISYFLFYMEASNILITMPYLVNLYRGIQISNLESIIDKCFLFELIRLYSQKFSDFIQSSIAFSQKQMTKQVVVIMEKQYPFGQCEQIPSELTKVVVRKKLPIFTYTRSNMVTKINLLRRLNHECMIKLNSLLQQQQIFHLLFEYVHIKVENWIININNQFAESFIEQLIQFSNFLADNHIILQFRLANVGMDQTYQAKYFLNLDFEVDLNVNKEKLKSAYIRDINSMFKTNVQKNQEIRKIEPSSNQQGLIVTFRGQKDDPQFKKQNNYEMESVIVSSNEGSRQNQAFMVKKSTSQQKRSVGPNSGSNYISNPSIVKHVPDNAPTELDDSYMKQFMDVLEIADGQERQNDLLMSQPGMKTVNARDQHLYKTVYHPNQVKSKQTANNRSFRDEKNRKESENNQNRQPVVLKKIHRSDARRAQQIHSQVAIAITNSLRVIDRFNNSKY